MNKIEDIKDLYKVNLINNFIKLCKLVIKIFIFFD